MHRSFWEARRNVCDCIWITGGSHLRFSYVDSFWEVKMSFIWILDKWFHLFTSLLLVNISRNFDSVCVSKQRFVEFAVKFQNLSTVEARVLAC